MFYNCSIDGGNSTINLVINGKRFGLSFPSIQSDPLSAKSDYNNAVNMRDNTTQMWDKLHVETILNSNEPKANENNRSEFLFGHMAEKYHKDLRSRQNFGKAEDKDLAKWMLTALAYALFETKRKTEGYVLKENDILQFNVSHLATGLPYREGSDEDKRNKYGQMFAGTHKIHFKHPIFKNLKIDLVVEEVFVFVEAEMALTLELNKEDGIYMSTPTEQLLNKKMAMIDIGGHTTEIITISYELEQDDNEVDFESYVDEYALSDVNVQQVTLTHLTDGIQRGIGTIMEDVIAEINNEYRKTGKPLKHLTRRDIEIAFTNRGMLNGRTGYILPEQIYVKDIFDKQAVNLATDIVQRTHAIYQGNNVISEIDTIFLCGGGSKISIMVETIRRQLGKLGYNVENIKVLDDPIFANAKGYYLALSHTVEDCDPLE